MWTRDLSTNQKAAAFVLIAFLLAVLIGVGLLLQEYGPGNMGIGLLQGAGVGLVVCAIVGWRVTGHPERAMTFERAFTQAGDERDDALLTRSLAVLGLAALPLTGVAAIAIGFGADVAMILFFLLMAQLAVAAISFAVIARRT